VGYPAPAEEAPRPAPPDPAALRPGAAAPRDALEGFFWTADEESPELPDLGLGHGARAAVAAQAEARREYVTFMLGAEEYGVEVERVREILRSPPITEVPRAPDHVLGVVTVRGEVITVIDPRRRLDLPPRAPDRAPRIVVCDTAQGLVGLLVDAVSQVARLLPSAIEPRPATLAGAGGEAIAGIGRERSRLIILLDLDLLLRPPGTETAA
jgi:purine-binding chemotaxis protein CheW